MIRPALAGDALLADIRAAGAVGDELHLWWLGQSGFLVQWNGRHLLLDPYLSDSLTRKYADTDKPHVRMTEIPVGPARLDFIDVATSSHNHTDHLDAETLAPLMRANAAMTLIVPEANRAFVAARLGCEPAWPVGLREGQSAEAAGFRFHAVPAAHEQLAPEYVGYVVECGPYRVYHPGDTVLYDGMAERIRPFAVDLALLPINGADPARRVAGNLNGREAAELANAVGARLAIPMHYDMFTFNTAPPDDFVARCRELNQPCRVVACGERITLSR